MGERHCIARHERKDDATAEGVPLDVETRGERRARLSLRWPRPGNARPNGIRAREAVAGTARSQVRFERAHRVAHLAGNRLIRSIAIGGVSWSPSTGEPKILRTTAMPRTTRPNAA